MQTPPEPQHLTLNGARLAVRHNPGHGPLIVFLPGYMSDMRGDKATALFEWAGARGHGCLLLDYSGCGASGGNFLDGSISRWTGEALALIDHVAPGASVLPVGSSMGGWVALRLGLALGPRLAGLIGIAAAPDFPDWGLSVTATEAQALAGQGWFTRASGYGGEYLYSRTFLEDAAPCRMLAGPVPITAPVRLLHGQADDVVPFQISLDIAARLASTDVQVTLIKDGDHRLSRASDLALLLAQVEALI